MFVYLSKKIAMPRPVRSLSYNRLEGYIACGGDDGVLKAVKLDAKIEDPKVRGLAAQSTLTMNQELEGHKAAVSVLAWNEKHQKLTSGDQNGLIIVWVLVKGVWYEEMVNNRSKCDVRHMKWNADGGKICIVYEDGQVILGSVDGNRIWAKDLRSTLLTHLEWSPNGRLLLFGTSAGEVLIHDSAGEPISKVLILCQSGISDAYKVAALEWYNGAHGYIEDGCPTLAICFGNGRCQFMRTELDDEPVLFNTQLSIVCAQWSHNGSVLAIGGQVVDSKNNSYICFYTPFGSHLRALTVPGTLSSCSWEGLSPRLGIAADSFVYFACIRPNYHWAYFANTVVYSFTKYDSSHQFVMFWDTVNNEKHVKFFNSLLAIVACGDFCCIVTRSDDLSVQQPFVIILCNSIGTPLDFKYIDMPPTYVAMTMSHVVVASRVAFYMWQFKNVKQRAVMEVSNRLKAGMEKLFHVDDIPSGIGGDTLDFNKATSPTEDPICAVCVSEKTLLVARETGTVNCYTMPALALTNKFTVKPKTTQLALNSTSTRLAAVDSSSIMTLYNIDSSSGQDTAAKGMLERKDVWSVKWAEDNQDLFAVMEKTRLVVVNGLEPEEPVSSSGYICQFKDLQVRCVLLDEIMPKPEHPELEFVVITETKSLREARVLLETTSIEEALKYVESHQHPRLWHLMAEYALSKVNLKVAEHSFVRCKDYSGIQLVKRLSNIQNDSMKQAEIAAFFGRYDEAEKLYIDLDRKDLAVALRKKLGDWFQVLQLLQSGSFGDDQQIEEACSAVGDYYADRQQWQQAVQYYVKGRNQQRIAKCYYMLEDYTGLSTLTNYLPENHKLLPEIAEMFVTIGMCQEAVDAFLKCGKVQQAIDTCVHLNQWDMAIDLARNHSVHETEPLLMKYAETLLDKHKTFSAIELYRKANHQVDAAKLLFQVAEKEAQRRSNPLRVKKLFVLAALLVEQYHQYMRSSQKEKTKKRRPEAASALAGLLEEDVATLFDTKVIDNAWRGAEAYHFFLLAQRQLYAGQLENAVKTSLYLREYEDVINPVDIYSLLGLAACSMKAYGVCSKAFIKLESVETLTPEQRRQYEELSVEIFAKFSAKDSRVNTIECPSCAGTISDMCTTCPGCDTKFSACIATGRPLFANPHWMCPSCKHNAYPNEINHRRSCPLCHAPVRA